MTVRIEVPSALAKDAGGQRVVELDTGDTTVARLLDRLRTEFPTLERRLRDEQSAVRQHVNVYVDDIDIRTLSGVDSAVPDGSLVMIIAAVSGG